MKIVQQIEFSTILFDSLFGLILFFCLDSFLEIKGILPFIFYLFSIIILVHWWLVFKSADDAFDEEVTDSAVDIAFGIIYVILIEYIILNAKIFEMINVTWFLVGLLAVDLIWALVWRYVGRWHTKDKLKIKRMETELNHNIWINSLMIVLFYFLINISQFLPPVFYAGGFIVLYLIYIIITFQKKIIDLRIF